MLGHSVGIMLFISYGGEGQFALAIIFCEVQDWGGAVASCFPIFGPSSFSLFGFFEWRNMQEQSAPVAESTCANTQ